VRERPIIVFDVNETLLDLQAIRPVLKGFSATRGHAPVVRRADHLL